MIKARTVINFLFAVLVFAAVAVPAAINVGPQASDFPAYYVTSTRIRAGEAADVYVVEHQREAGRKLSPDINPLVVEPPYALFAAAPLSVVPFALAKAVFTGLLITAMAAAVIVLSRSLLLTNRQTLILIGLVAGSGPVFEIFKISKPIPFFLLAMMVSLWFLRKNQDYKSGVVAAVCLFKPQFFLPYLLFAAGAGRLRFIVGCAAAGLALVVISLPIFGVQGYSNFFALLSQISAHPELAGVEMMPVLKGQLLRLNISTSLSAALTNGIYGLALLLLVLLGRSKHKLVHWWIPGVVAGFGSVACFYPYMHLYDLVIIIPSLCFVALSQSKENRQIIFVLMVLSLIWFMNPIYVFVHYYWLSHSAPINLHFVALLVLAAICGGAAIRFKDTDFTFNAETASSQDN